MNLEAEGLESSESRGWGDPSKTRLPGVFKGRAPQTAPPQLPSPGLGCLNGAGRGVRTGLE